MWHGVWKPVEQSHGQENGAEILDSDNADWREILECAHVLSKKICRSAESDERDSTAVSGAALITHPVAALMKHLGGKCDTRLSAQRPVLRTADIFLKNVAGWWSS